MRFVFHILSVLDNKEVKRQGDQEARAHLWVYPDRETPLFDIACDAEGVCGRTAEIFFTW